MFERLARICVSLAACVLLAPVVASAQTLAAAVLPSGRSVTVGATATAYASIVNVGSAAATGCRIAPVTQVPATFSYQTTNSATNAPTGSANTPADIPAGGSQSFVFSFTPSAAFAPTDINLSFSCTNASAAAVVSGVNTLLLSASSTPVPDIIATAATTTNDGVAHIPSASGTGFFSTAAVNIGAPGSMTITPIVLGGAQAAAFVCETNSTTGACLAPPSASVQSGVSTGETRTYSVFVAGQGSLVAPDFAARRVRLEFRDAGGAVRGATSVAVCTVGTTGCDVLLPYIAVNTDVTKNVYPATYTTVTMKAQADPCDVHGDKVYYPPSWNGTQALPDVTGAPLNPAYLRHVNLKDILASQTTPNGCTQLNDAAELPRTFARLKAMNTDVVTITQWHWAFIKPDGSFGITGDTGGALSDADLTAYVQAAHAAGLKVMLTNQVQGFVDDAVNQHCCLDTPPGNAQNWAKWLAAFQTFMHGRASFFQGLGVDYWELGCGACIYGDSGDSSSAANQMFAAAYQSVLSDITPIYHGKKYMFTSSWLSSTPNVLAGLDAIETGLFWASPLTPAEESALTVASMKARIQAGDGVNAMNRVIQLGKPVMSFVGMQSRANALSVPGYMEETGCTSGFGQLQVGVGGCIERETTTDFALQAILIEAELEIMATLNFPAGSIISVSDYYQSDVITTEPTFPNIAYSVRNKPAEGIIKQWFAR